MFLSTYDRKNGPKMHPLRRGAYLEKENLSNQSWAGRVTVYWPGPTT